MHGTAAADRTQVVENAPGLRRRYEQIRRFTEALCEPLGTEDYVVQSMPDVSPTKWHLAHTSWFFETFLLIPHSPGYEVFHPQYGYLFNSYYVSVGERWYRPERGLLSRPTVADIYRYRKYVDEKMRGWLEALEPAALADRAPLIELGLNHEQQHQELMVTDIKHVFGINPLRPALVPARQEKKTQMPPLDWAAFEGGVHWVGHADNSFSYDNELPPHRALLEPFQLGSRPVTNGEYLAFMDDGGYSRPTLWLSEGWATVEQQRWTAPLYWTRQDGEWFQYTLAGMQPVDRSECLCHVSYFEADAYARWAGARLPTEFEWEVAAQGVPVEGHFAESRRFHPASAVSRPAGDSPPQQMFGDVWEWTRSPYSPYPGCVPASGAVGEYNGKFMCNQFVLRGGSCATPRSHIRRTYRNFFPPAARWQFSGFRLARDA